MLPSSQQRTAARRRRPASLESMLIAALHAVPGLLRPTVTAAAHGSTVEAWDMYGQWSLDHVQSQASCSVLHSQPQTLEQLPPGSSEAVKVS